jgi:Transglutaminase-like superfamily
MERSLRRYPPQLGIRSMTAQSLKRLVVDPVARGLVIEAAFLVVCVWAGVRLLRYPRLQRVLDRYARSRAARSAAAPSTIGGVRWALAAVSRYFTPATCLVSALAASTMLRRRGVPSQFRIGVRVTPASVTRLQAHAWVEVNGHVVVGAIDGLSEFSPFAF